MFSYFRLREVFTNSKIIPFVFLLALGMIVLQQRAEAHPLNNGYSEVTIENKSVTYDLVIPEASLLAYDSNKDHQLSLDELTNQKVGIETYLKNHLQLEYNSSPLEFSLVSMEKTDRVGIPAVEFVLRYTSKQAVENLTIKYNLLFDDIDPLHSNFLIISKDNDVDQVVFYSENRVFHYKPFQETSLVSSAWQYFILGIQHILTGYDHLLFLLSLIMVATRLKDVVKIVTAFTIAHSITLILASTGHISINSRWIEVGIALTIAYVAVENPIIKSVKMRWLLTFFFGLIHGMGFAGAISEVGLPEKYLISSLLSFNVGVETGQLAIVLLVLPFLLRLQKYKWYRSLLITVSIVVFLIAMYWFAQRIGWIS